MMYVFQFDKHNRVASYSKKKIETNALEQVELEVTPEQEDMMKNNYILYIRDGQLVGEKPKWKEDEDKAKNMEIAKTEFQKKMDAGTAKLADALALLQQIIK